jgi:transposase
MLSMLVSKVVKCRNCGYEVNADFNAVKNIEKRPLGYMLEDGAVLLPMSCPEQQAQEVLK